MQPTDNHFHEPQKQVPFSTKVQNTIHAVKALRLCIEEENAALHDYDYKRVKTISERKKDLSAHYAETMEDLIPHAEQLKKLPEPVKDVLREEKNRFDAACDDNKKLLTRATNMATRLSNRIVSMAKTAMHEQSVNYSRYGTANKAFKRPVYVQMNETF